MKKHMRETIAACRDAFPSARNVRVEGGSRHPRLCLVLGDREIRATISSSPSVPDFVAEKTVAQLRKQLGTMETRI